MSEQIVLGIDPGVNVLGYTLGRFKGSQRSAAAGDLRDVSPAKLARWMNLLCCQHRPDVIAIEGYDWQGAARSANQNSFSISRLVGDIEGAAEMWSVVCMDGTVKVVRVSKVDANRSIGLIGKASKARVKAAVEALFPLTDFANEHQRDSALVCMSGRLITRSGHGS